MKLKTYGYIGYALLAVGLAFFISPFVAPSYTTLYLFLASMPVISISFIFIFVLSRLRRAKWRYHMVYIVDLKNQAKDKDKSNHLHYNWREYDPDLTPDAMMPEPMQPYLRNYEYIQRLEGSKSAKIPGYRTWKRSEKLKYLFKPLRVGIMFWDSELNMPVTHSMAQINQDMISPHHLERICKSPLADLYFKSLDKTGLSMFGNKKLLIIIVVAAAILLVGTKIMRLW